MFFLIIMVHSDKKYMELSNFAKSFNYGTILDDVKSFFGYLHDKDEVDDIGLKLQICVKNSKPMYLHGFVISSALHQYLEQNNYNNITILETGTARGFSSVMMARIMQNFNIDGTIHTLDHVDRFDNCLKAAQLNRSVSINECVEEWKPIVDKYIVFEKGDSNKKLKQLSDTLTRINFAFLDGAHYYKHLTNELNFTEKRQLIGDVIVCDDYTKTQFPEICKAIDDFLNNGKYEHKIFYGDDGTKKRGYVFMKKIKE